jgi:hypothetical protein
MAQPQAWSAQFTTRYRLDEADLTCGTGMFPIVTIITGQIEGD